METGENLQQICIQVRIYNKYGYGWEYTTNMDTGENILYNKYGYGWEYTTNMDIVGNILYNKY